jgi:hypothetical protein
MEQFTSSEIRDVFFNNLRWEKWYHSVIMAITDWHETIDTKVVEQLLVKTMKDLWIEEPYECIYNASMW